LGGCGGSAFGDLYSGRPVRILVIHGPNLDLLGIREPEIYGRESLEEINRRVLELCEELGYEVEIMQSNSEGEIVSAIGRAYGRFDFLIINAAAYTHTSLAIHDAIRAVGIPTIEVHLSNIYAREEERRRSLISPVAVGVISGFGPGSYLLAIRAIEFIISRKADG
jgi:3-dehydroquinate dehydratase-2